jgi:MoaA/NifB/PqqE/SkfB family radical SAM enzyme
MPLGTFERLLEKLPKTVTQIAFGIGDIEANPDMWEIFKLCRLNGIIPNVTVNGEGITDEIADKLSNLCGAVAVSVYDKNKSYDTVKKLTDRGMTQVNIHFMICEETCDLAYEIMADKLTDPRLEKLNAIVLLSLKPKGRASKSDYTRLSQEKFTALVDFALCNKIGIGFDSCGCGKFVDAIKNSPDAEKYMQMAEPCESGLFSSYFNTEGKFFPCSFAEGSEGWEDGIDIIHSDTDLWNSPRVLEWRKKLLECKRSCPMYNI